MTAGASAHAGGLVGYDIGATGVSVSNAYATGNVAAGNSSDVGGFAGLNDLNISDAYSTGTAAGGTSSSVGGFIGEEDYGYSMISSAYWDTTTSGISTQGIGLYSLSAGGTDPQPTVTGLTTEELQAALPGGFSPAVWAVSPGINGGLPYLLALSASY